MPDPRKCCILEVCCTGGSPEFYLAWAQELCIGLDSDWSALTDEERANLMRIAKYMGDKYKLTSR